MYIYIRHGHKAYKNGKPRPGDPSHDPPLTEEGKNKAIIVAKELLSLYPNPSLIVSSPFRRARETAMIMAKIAGFPESSINYDNNLGEYLGNHSGSELEVSPNTLRHHPIHPETYDQFCRRVEKYVSRRDKTEDVIWVITHGIVISKICPFSRIPYLGYIVVKDGTLTCP